MSPLISMYVRGVTGINRFFFNLVSLLIFLIVLSMLYEVVSRYLFHTPTTWGMELATLLFGPYFLLGGAYLLHLRGHVNLDLLKNKLSKTTQRRLEIFSYLVILAFSVIIFCYSYTPAIESWQYQETSFSAWNPPIWPVKFAIPLSVALLGLQCIAELLCTVLDKDREHAQ